MAPPWVARQVAGLLLAVACGPAVAVAAAGQPAPAPAEANSRAPATGISTPPSPAEIKAEALGTGDVRALQAATSSGAGTNDATISLSPAEIKAEQTKLLRMAIGNGDITALQAAISSGADVNDASNSDLWTPLMLATQQTHSNVAQVVQALITAKADVDQADTRGRTALFFAGLHGNAGAIAVLASAKDKDPSDNYQVSALNWAVQKGHVEAAAALIRIGANPEYGDSMGGNTPLSEAQMSKDNRMRAVFNLTLVTADSTSRPSEL